MNVHSPVEPVEPRWSAPPLLADAWHALAPVEAMPVMIRLCAENAAARAICVQHDIIAVRLRALIAIRDGLLIEFLAAPHSGSHSRIGAFVYRPGLFDLLDGAAAVLHGIAAEDGLVLETAEHALEYARLFCAAMKGDSGSFFPIAADAPIVQAADHPDLATSLAALQRPASATPAADGGWEIDIALAYGPMLFRSHLLLRPSGTIDMLRDRHLCGLAPLRIEGWDGGLRTQVDLPADDFPSLPCLTCAAAAAEDPDDDDVPF